jgi:hypothetical protein
MATRAKARALHARLGLTSLYHLRAETARASPSARLAPARVHHDSLVVTGGLTKRRFDDPVELGLPPTFA